MMWSSIVLFAAAASAASIPKHVPTPDADGKYTITAPGIKAQVGHPLPYFP